jgi:hypothetical protein
VKSPKSRVAGVGHVTSEQDMITFTPLPLFPLFSLRLYSPKQQPAIA